ncbi:MAG: acylphosphatase [Blastopirellula sp.]|nr:MAG: acylphosphatase [Blastopirellula sp.]
MVGYQLLFSGQVQGVGFRATSKRLADKYLVTGWVKNLPDGRVEMLVEGQKSQCAEFLQHLRERLDDFISDCETTQRVSSKGFTAFDVRY